MSKIDHTWHAGPPPAPDVYTTRRNDSKYLTLRFWDGMSWFEIGASGRGGVAFAWPKRSRSKKPAWLSHYGGIAHLRKIGVHQGSIQWGEPFKVFDQREVLKYLVASGRLPADWLQCFQAEMRAKKGGAA